MEIIVSEYGMGALFLGMSIMVVRIIGMVMNLI